MKFNDFVKYQVIDLLMKFCKIGCVLVKEKRKFNQILDSEVVSDLLSYLLSSS